MTVLVIALCLIIGGAPLSNGDLQTLLACAALPRSTITGCLKSLAKETTEEPVRQAAKALSDKVEIAPEFLASEPRPPILLYRPAIDVARFRTAKKVTSPQIFELEVNPDGTIQKVRRRTAPSGSPELDGYLEKVVAASIALPEYRNGHYVDSHLVVSVFLDPR